MAAGGDDQWPTTGSHGHYFLKKNFHKPSYCHHCSDLVWGLLGQGYVCEVCNFVVHDRCLKGVVSPCIHIATALIETPVAHFWAESNHHSQKRRFCNVCRKRLDDTYSFRCEVCDYHVHAECQDGALPNCRQASTYTPGWTLEDIRPTHYWREGNLPTGAKCIYCRKSCWSAECLAGWKCEWCGFAVHSMCYKSVNPECNYGVLAPSLLPPHAVSNNCHTVALETLIGSQPRRRETASPRSISEDFSSGGGEAANKSFRESDDNYSQSRERDRSRERDDRDEELIKVYDGIASFRHHSYKLISVPRHTSVEQLVAAAMWAFHLTGDPGDYYLTDLCGNSEKEIEEPYPIPLLTRVDGRKPALLLRFRESTDSGWVRVHAGRLQVSESPKLVPVSSGTSAASLLSESLPLFGLESANPEDFSVTEIIMHKGVSERVLARDEIPWESLKQIGRESLRQMQRTRFYLQPKEVPCSENLAVFVSNLPFNLSQRQYEKILLDILGKDNKYSSIGPIYYEYGSMVLTYQNFDDAIQACYILKDATYEERSLSAALLPNIIPQLIPPGVQPLLVFVNVKSGGCQGLELVTSFRKLLNPYQVYDLDIGGPLPGLYVFRHVKDYRILVCGGDGTIGWVLQCLDNVGQDSECSSPPCAIVPLGTGNDLARVLRWGSGYTGGEDPLNLLRDVIEAEEIRLDRWTVVFHPSDEKLFEDGKGGCGTGGVMSTSTAISNEDNTQIFVMNNYFGIGIDADLCLDFHNAREENPNKFNSRLHNKGVYVKMGIRKMMGRKMCKDMHKEIRLEVDGKIVELPPVEGIIILNILSWGSGANPWGFERDDQFSVPNHWDGMLEVVGVTGVLHLGQIQSGLRSAIRIAQGGHIRIRMNSELPIQVDGEPWIQCAGEIVVLKSALKATMLKKKKGNIPSSAMSQTSNHTAGNSKIRCPAVIPATSELDNSGFDESQSTPGNKTQIYSTTV
ncbi:diacylglycerol kinase theta-like [Daphnia carinata]|uniref:diacylglycerol kinase theta-like n=1 Tax=Daphnia carinata TaxID=120202 RepID=UPI00257B44D4|nr:diacylglycerol kinase theta-like [Daphnia carinata]XP_057371950.1 diacylglycerol kinase theta-like [Daphnia carinata]